jgi:hypothetical protein
MNHWRDAALQAAHFPAKGTPASQTQLGSDRHL